VNFFQIIYTEKQTLTCALSFAGFTNGNPLNNLLMKPSSKDVNIHNVHPVNSTYVKIWNRCLNFAKLLNGSSGKPKVCIICQKFLNWQKTFIWKKQNYKKYILSSTDFEGVDDIPSTEIFLEEMNPPPRRHSKRIADQKVWLLSSQQDSQRMSELILHHSKIYLDVI